MSKFDLIVAMDSKLGIGKNDTLPWHFSEDLKYFKKLTTTTSSELKKNAVIMGRKTWESLPKHVQPLPDRINVVLTKQEDYELPANVFKTNSVEQALQIVFSRKDVERIFVIGGAQIFIDVVNRPECEKLYATHIEHDFKCDVNFPQFLNSFKLINSSKMHEQDGISYNFCEYEKK